MIRIPGAKLIPINYNPHSGSTACALVVNDAPTLRALSKHTGGSADGGPYKAEFEELADIVDKAFQSSTYRNKSDPRRLEPYQKLGVAFALGKKGRAGLFDPMGLGKTIQAVAMAVACPGRYLPLVVICPRNAIGAWQKQLGDADKSDAWVEPGKIRVRVIDTQKSLVEAAKEISRSPKMRSEAYIIWNYMLTAPANELDAGARDAALLTIANALTVHGLLVMDEAHYFRVPTSEMFRRGYMMARTAAHVLALTGTPSLSSVTQTLPILALVDPNSSVIPALRDFPSVVGRTPLTETEEEAALLAEQAAAKSGPNKPGPSDPWGLLQSKFIATYAGEEGVGSVKETPLLKEFSPDYTADYAKAVENDFRQMVVRRSRADAVTKTVSPPLKVGVAKKDRTLLLEPVPRHIQLSKTSDDPFRFYQRAGLMALVDGVILRLIFDKHLTPQQTPERQLHEVESNEDIQNYLREFKCATTTLQSGIGDASARLMGQVVAPAAARRFGEQKHRPTVYFMDNVETANDLAGRLWNLYHHIPNFELHIYHGKKAGEVKNSKVSKKGFTDESTLYDVDLHKNEGKDYLKKVANRFKPKDYNAPRILVSTQAGREGVDLPAGAEVIFIQRFESPGLEEQAEDRINRADRDPAAPRPKVVYYMPDHYNSFVILNRLERRRTAALKTYGETPASDYSTPLVFAHQDDSGDGRADYLRRSFAAESDVTNNFQGYLLSRIQWAFRKLQTLNHQAFAGLMAALSGKDAPTHVYEGLMKLPKLYPYELWCEDLADPKAAGQKGKREPPPKVDRTGAPTAKEGTIETTPEGRPFRHKRHPLFKVESGEDTFYAGQWGAWTEVPDDQIVPIGSEKRYFCQIAPDGSGIFGQLGARRPIGALPDTVYYEGRDYEGNLEYPMKARPLLKPPAGTKYYLWTAKRRPNPRRRNPRWPF
jgi:superfamily II DNA or RNA helicase